MGRRESVRRDPVVRRRQLVEAAFEVLAERGTDGTRLSDIAERAGVASSLVTYYFPNKDDLLLEATRFGVDRFYTEQSAELARIEDPWERLESAIRQTLPVGARDADWMILVQFWARAIYRSDLQSVAAMFQTRARGLYVSIIESGTASGRFHPAGTTERAASAIIGMIDGLAIRVILHDDAIDPNEMGEQLLAFARLVVGMEPEEPA
jgi:AcrR family transcriptional regulator